MRYERSLAIAQRLADLLALIKAGLYSSHALSKQLGVSEQTVYRDILCLKQQGHPVRSVKHSSHWAYELAKTTTDQSSREGLHA